MKTGQYIRMLAEFVTGESDFSEFAQHVEERLFELRQTPEITEEKKLLSGVELYLHEAEEGQRSRFEVYTYVQSIVDDIIVLFSTSEDKTESLQPVVPHVPYLVSTIFDGNLEPSGKGCTVTKNLPLVASR